MNHRQNVLVGNIGTLNGSKPFQERSNSSKKPSEQISKQVSMNCKIKAANENKTVVRASNTKSVSNSNRFFRGNVSESVNNRSNVGQPISLSQLSVEHRQLCIEMLMRQQLQPLSCKNRNGYNDQDQQGEVIVVVTPTQIQHTLQYNPNSNNQLPVNANKENKYQVNQNRTSQYNDSQRIKSNIHIGDTKINLNANPNPKIKNIQSVAGTNNNKTSHQKPTMIVKSPIIPPNPSSTLVPKTPQLQLPSIPPLKQFPSLHKPLPALITNSPLQVFNMYHTYTSIYAQTRRMPIEQVAAWIQLTYQSYYINNNNRVNTTLDVQFTEFVYLKIINCSQSNHSSNSNAKVNSESFLLSILTSILHYCPKSIHISLFVGFVSLKLTEQQLKLYLQIRRHICTSKALTNLKHHQPCTISQQTVKDIIKCAVSLLSSDQKVKLWTISSLEANSQCQLEEKKANQRILNDLQNHIDGKQLCEKIFHWCTQLLLVHYNPSQRRNEADLWKLIQWLLGKLPVTNICTVNQSKQTKDNPMAYQPTQLNVHYNTNDKLYQSNDKLYQLTPNKMSSTDVLTKYFHDASQTPVAMEQQVQQEEQYLQGHHLNSFEASFDPNWNQYHYHELLDNTNNCQLAQQLNHSKGVETNSIKPSQNQQHQSPKPSINQPFPFSAIISQHLQQLANRYSLKDGTPIKAKLTKWGQIMGAAIDKSDKRRWMEFITKSVPPNQYLRNVTFIEKLQLFYKIYQQNPIAQNLQMLTKQALRAPGLRAILANKFVFQMPF